MAIASSKTMSMEKVPEECPLEFATDFEHDRKPKPMASPTSFSTTSSPISISAPKATFVSHPRETTILSPSDTTLAEALRLYSQIKNLRKSIKRNLKNDKELGASKPAPNTQSNINYAKKLKRDLEINKALLKMSPDKYSQYKLMIKFA